MDRRELVIERAIPAIIGQAADDRVQDFHARLAGRCQQSLLVRYRALGRFGVEIVLRTPIGVSGVEPGLEPDTLHVNEQQRCFAAAILRVAARGWVGHERLRVASGRFCDLGSLFATVTAFSLRMCSMRLTRSSRAWESCATMWANSASICATAGASESYGEPTSPEATNTTLACAAIGERQGSVNSTIGTPRPAA